MCSRKYEDSGTDYFTEQFKDPEDQGHTRMSPPKIKYRYFSSCTLSTKKEAQSQLGLFRFWWQHSTARKTPPVHLPSDTENDRF